MANLPADYKKINRAIYKWKGAPMPVQLKYLEWNLNARGNYINYTIPPFVIDYIKTVDIAVLVEFQNGTNWYEFRSKLEPEYILCVSPHVSDNFNQVCIALRRNRNIKIENILVKNIFDQNIPEFLQLDVKIDDKTLSIIGTRIKTEGNSKPAQYDFLKKRIEYLENILCVGDFNCTSKTLQQKMGNTLDVYGPRIAKGYFSYVFENNNSQGLDWVITKGIQKIYNPYQDQNNSPFATYDWSFISRANGYGHKTKHDFLNISGLPDHAILTGIIEL